ncbi:MAG: hypothetical protein CMJ94_07970 [Planctomycetes bacterium]|mgnify:CR=1 FL=1|nr:hypothetical protein [Planctomycetota bacterium]
MLAFLRQLARALTGKVDALEFALGVFFGTWLGLLPMHEVDPGTGILGLNGLWLLVLFLFLLLKASIPVGVVFAALVQALGIAFLDELAFGFGQSTLDGMGPDGAAAGWYASMPSLQLHTYWGFGAAVFGFVAALLLTIPLYFVFKKKLPAWRERFGQSRLAQALSGFFVFRALRFLLR